MEIRIGANKTLTQVSSEPYWITCQAESKPTGERVWFKILSQDLYSDEELIARFHQSAKIGSGLRHANILACYEDGIEESLHYIAIEYFQGKRLLDILAAEKRLPLKRAVQIVSQIAQALQYAHIQGVLHGALSPHSIYVGKNDFVKVMDFGSQELMEYLLHSRADKTVLALARYVSPEQAVPGSQITGRSDIYSLGILFYEMLTGRVPFEKKNLRAILRAHKEQPAPSPRAVVPNLPMQIEKMVLRQLEKDPADRFANCSQLLWELNPDYKEKVLDENKEDAWGTSSWGTGASWFSEKVLDKLRLFSPTLVGSRRRITAAFFSISLVVVIVALVTLLSGLGRRSSDQDMYVYLDWMAEEAAGEDTGFPVDSSLQQRSEDVVREDNTLARNGSKSQVEPKRTSTNSNTLPRSETYERPAQIKQRQTQQLPTDRDDQHRVPGVETPKIITPPREQVPSAKYAVLFVNALADSIPTTATVYLDNQLMGQTSPKEPLRIPRVICEKAHALRVEKAGYQNAESQITVKVNERNLASVNLAPLVDAIRRFYFQETSFADRVIINNQLPSRPLPCEIDLAVGKHNIKYIDSRTGFSWATQLDLDLNSPNQIYFKAEDVGYGTLTVFLQNAVQFGYAYVQLDGETSLNKTTPYRTKVPVGRHSVRVSREGFTITPTDTTVFVGLDQEISIAFKLTPQ